MLLKLVKRLQFVYRSGLNDPRIVKSCVNMAYICEELVIFEHDRAVDICRYWPDAVWSVLETNSAGDITSSNASFNMLSFDGRYECTYVLQLSSGVDDLIKAKVG